MTKKYLSLRDSQGGDYAIKKNLNSGDYEITQRREFISGGDKSFSHSWILKGFSHVKKNETITVDKFLSLPYSERKYKNGKGQWHIVDIDHGTTRQWNTEVISLYETDTP